MTRFREDDGARCKPSADEVAKAWVLGGLALTVVNAIAIAVAQPWPAGGALLRIQHHLFDALHVCGFAAMGALIAAAFAYAPSRLWPLGWSLYAAMSCCLLWPLLDRTFTREAIVLATTLGLPVPGPATGIIRATLSLLIGLAIPATHWVTKLFFRHRFGRPVVAVASIIGLIIGHSVLRDEYEDVHAAILWPAALVMGACLTPLWPKRFDQPRARTVLFVAGALLASTTLLVPPSSAVRLEIFRAPGGFASFALARTVWRVPTMPGANDRIGFTDPALIPSTEPLTEGPVLVILGIDAIRGDVLSGVEHDAQLPRMRELRDDGAYFPRAIAPGSQTSITYTSMFSGRYASQLRWAYHGAGKARRLYAAADPTPRFPELLSDSGVRTVSFLSPGFLRGEFGVVRGFREETLVSVRHAEARKQMWPLLQEIRSHDGGAALFFTHLMDPHEPYDRGRLRTGSAKERYFSELTLVDAWVGTLLHLMKTRFPDRGYVVLLGDHGEAFGEHGTTFHSKTLYQELVHVPLIFWGPGIAPGRHDDWVSLMDLGPTLLQLFGQPVPPAMMGESLRPALDGKSQPPRLRPIAAEGRRKRALILPTGLKAIENLRHKTIEAYDLERDPLEQNNLVSSDPVRAARALSALRSFFAHYAPEQKGYRPPYKR